MLDANLGLITIYFVAVCECSLFFQAKVEDSPSEQVMSSLYTILIYVSTFHVNDLIRRHTTSATKTAS
jgi:hypothetical protein